MPEERHPRAPNLKEGEQDQAEERSAPHARVVHEVIRREGEEELERPSEALFWSGLAAGLSMGFSLIAEGLLRAHLPDASWRLLLVSLGYTVGFLIVVLGRQQLFTENTLTVILPLLVRRDARTFGQVARLWAIVLFANILGTVVIAWVLGNTDLFHADVRSAFNEIAREAGGAPFWTVVLRGIFGGWLIALMVWLLPHAESARVLVIVAVTYVVGLGGFSHIIVGSVEQAYLVWLGEAGVGQYLGGFWVPTLIGNVIGGVSLVAVLNHAQVVHGEGDGEDP